MGKYYLGGVGQVTLRDPIRHVSSRSGEACLRTAISGYFTLLTLLIHSGQPKPSLRRRWKVLSGLEGLLEIVGLNGGMCQSRSYKFGELKGLPANLRNISDTAHH